jgi:hypothetical protein
MLSQVDLASSPGPLSISKLARKKLGDRERGPGDEAKVVSTLNACRWKRCGSRPGDEAEFVHATYTSIRATARLCEAECSDMLPSRQFGEVL